MMKSPKWIERFGISPSDLSNWKSEQEALQAFLLDGRISQQEFLSWASDTLNLPVVKDDFFAIPADSVFWEHVKGLGSWNSSHFPLWEWDGVMLIGCIHPPENFSFKSEHRFVLASAQNLKSYWEKFLSSKKSDATMAEPKPTPPPSQAQDVVSSEAPSAAAPPSGDPRISSSIPRRRRGKPIDENAPQAAPSEGTNAAIGAPSPAVAAATSPASTAKPQPKPAPQSKSVASFDAPDGLVGLGSFNDSPSDAGFGFGADIPDGLTMPGIKLDSLNFDDASMILPDGIQEKTTIGDKVFEFTSVLAREPKKEKTRISSAAVLRQQQEVDDNDVETTSITHLGRASIVSSHDEELPSEVTQSGAAPIRPMNACVSLDDLGELALAHVLKIFDAAMILIYQDEQLSPWKWSDLLKSEANDQLTSVDLSTPSIFRIVRRTQLPYHGYVAPSEENERFFSAFHGGTLPAHVTLVPIIWDGMMVGMLMGVSNMEISYKSSLLETEKIADELADQIMRIRASMAA